MDISRVKGKQRSPYEKGKTKNKGKGKHSKGNQPEWWLGRRAKARANRPKGKGADGCLQCERPGHWKRHCPQLRQVRERPCDDYDIRIQTTSMIWPAKRLATGGFLRCEWRRGR